jgi:hypothetical protein
MYRLADVKSLFTDYPEMESVLAADFLELKQLNKAGDVEQLKKVLNAKAKPSSLRKVLNVG